jgi:hypothetical protein
MEKNPDPGFAMNIPDFFGLKILKFFYEDPDSGSGIISSLDLGSGTEKIQTEINIPDPQHCLPV